MDKKKEYLIGDVSRIVGLSRDALRFYEKKGIIHAKKKENGYRYFSDEDIYRLMCIVYRRKMNDSLEEIKDFVKDDMPVAHMRQHLERRIGDEEEEICRRRQTIARLKLSIHDMENIEAYEGKCVLKELPAAYILDTCEDLYDSLRQWFSMSSEVSGLDMAYFYNVFSMRNGMLENEGTQLLIYKGLEPFINSGFDLSACLSTEPLPCVYRVEASKDLLPDAAAAETMADWASSQGFVPTGVFYSNNMTSFLGEDTNIYYLELYMPVIPAGKQK